VTIRSNSRCRDAAQDSVPDCNRHETLVPPSCRYYDDDDDHHHHHDDDSGSSFVKSPAAWWWCLFFGPGLSKRNGSLVGCCQAAAPRSARRQHAILSNNDNGPQTHHSSQHHDGRSTDSTPTNWETRRWAECVIDHLRWQPQAVNDEHRNNGARQARQTLDIDMIPFKTQENGL
jgi:hypothetical protein